MDGALVVSTTFGQGSRCLRRWMSCSPGETLEMERGEAVSSRRWAAASLTLGSEHAMAGGSAALAPQKGRGPRPS